MKIEEVRRGYEKELLRKANVVRVMTGYKIKEEKKTDELSIVCMVEKKKPEGELRKKDIIPKEIEGIPIDVVESGEFRAL